MSSFLTQVRLHCPALKPHSAPFSHLRHLTQHLASTCMQTAERCRKHPLLCSWTHFTVKTTFQMGPKHCQPPRYISLKDSPFLSQITCSTPLPHLPSATHHLHPHRWLPLKFHSHGRCSREEPPHLPTSSPTTCIPSSYGGRPLFSKSKPSTCHPDPSLSAPLRLNPCRCPLFLLPYPFLLYWIIPVGKHTKPQKHLPLALLSHHPIFLLRFTAKLLKEVCFLHHHFLSPQSLLNPLQ